MQVPSIDSRGPIALAELASGVDAFYCSGRAALPSDFVAGLERSRAEALELGCDVDFDLAETRFRMAPRGLSKYRFRLQHEFGIIALTASRSLPAIRVQPRAEFLHAITPEYALQWFKDHLEVAVGPILWSVARIDLFADFQGWSPNGDSRSEFVFRGRQLGTYEEHEELTGFLFGNRSSQTVNARIYDKTREIEKKGTDYWYEIWGTRYDASKPVFRTEFEVHRGLLREFGISSPEEVLEASGSLWSYLTAEWLTHRVPTADYTRSRWPISPEWECVLRAQIAGDGAGLERVRDGNTAGSLRLMLPALNGYVASFASLFGINDPIEACHLLGPYLRQYEENSGTEFANRVKEKQRRRFLP